MRWWHKQPQGVEPEQTLVEETEDFLRGRYLEVAFANGREMPAWTWISALAHGDDVSLDIVSQWTSGFAGSRPEYESWGRVIEQLARQVRVVIDTTGLGLDDIQHDVLVPFELAIMNTAVGPGTLYRVVTMMLRNVESRAESGHA